MAYELSIDAKAAASKTNKEPQLILEIEGVSTVYAMAEVLRVPRFDDGYVFNQAGLYFDVPIRDENIKDFISLSGTTRAITSQVEPSKEGATSVSSMNISIIDKDNYVSEELYSAEIMTKSADVYLSFKGLEHPNNSIRIFSGLINSFNVEQGSVKIGIYNPEDLKRQEIFVTIQDELNGAITGTQTLITLSNSNGIIGSGDDVTTYLRIEDELLEVTDISANDLTVIRGQLNSAAVAHDDETEISTVYRIQGKPIDIALKMMLSSKDEYFAVREPTYFVSNNLVTKENAIFFNEYNIEDKLGLTAGDFLSIQGSTTSYPTVLTIKNFGLTSNKTSYVTTIESITEEPVIAGTTVSFKSKYNVYNDGAGFKNSEVDINQHEYIRDTFILSAPDLDFKMEDSVNVRGFINKELFFPSGIYPVPRSGRASCTYHAPPISTGLTKTLDITNITRPETLSIKRSTKKDFYNNVVYKFNKDILAGKFLNNNITASASALSKLRTGNSPLTIESLGFVNNQDTVNFIEATAVRYLDRYQYAAESIEVQCKYGVGFSIEIGDTVVLDARELNLYDSKTGKRNTFKRVMEVVNKSLDITGTIKLSLLDSLFSVDGRYATVAPSSYIGPNSTVNRLELIPTQGLNATDEEWEKWSKFFGSKVKISDAGQVNEMAGEIIVESVDSADTNYLIMSGMTVEPNIGDIITAPDYASASNDFKLLSCYQDSEGTILTGIDNFSFTVGASEIGDYFTGQKITILDSSFNKISESLTISDITGTTITTAENIGFVPAADQIISFASYDDNEPAYLIL